MPWFETVAGSRLWYEEYGSGTPIVFIHGWCMSSAVWELQREGLESSFRVLLLDLQGHGKSSLHSNGFQIGGCAEDIAALLGHLGMHDVILAGWSLGAFIAIETYLLCKERISGLILISGTPQFLQSADFPYGLSQTEAEGMAKKVQRNLRRALDGFFTLMFAPGEDESEDIQKLLSSVTEPTTDVALQALEALVEADMRDRLALVAIPTLIMHGDCDDICLPKASEFMSMRIPMSRQVIFSGCGHVPFLTQSSAFNDAIKEFRVSMSGGVYKQG